MLKMSELIKMDKKVIEAKINELRTETFELKLKKSTTGLEKPHVMRDVKKDIARLSTVLNMKSEK